MRLNTIIITPLLGVVAVPTAALSLNPWLISRLTTFSPPDRPESPMLSVINITISDPNEATVVSTICAGTWTYDEPPYGKVNKCSEVPGGQWTFAMLESEGTSASSPSPTTNFRLRFELKKGSEVFAGTERFLVGDNLSGLCSAGGVCSFRLKEEKTPFPVPQVRVE